MPRRVNKRKAIQAAKRAAQAAEDARKNKRWPGTRRVGFIAHHKKTAALTSLLLAVGAVKITLKDP
jgi:hypothetical protein